MPFRDSLLAAQTRIQALEQELSQSQKTANETASLERENRRLRAALARARSDYMPTLARLLNVGLSAAGVLAAYLLIKLGLSLAGTELHLPTVSIVAFGGMLVGYFALCQLSFGTTAPTGLMFGLFCFNQLAISGTGLTMSAIAQVSWLCMIVLGAYVIWRAHHIPTVLARVSATTLALTGLAQLLVGLNWDYLDWLARQGNITAEGLLPLIADGLLTLYLGSVVTVGLCFFAARKRLLQTAPTPPEVDK